MNQLTLEDYEQKWTAYFFHAVLGIKVWHVARHGNLTYCYVCGTQPIQMTRGAKEVDATRKDGELVGLCYMCGGLGKNRF